VRGLISFVVVAVTVIVQLTIVDRIAFPGGAGPNLVLLAVAALALAGGPLTGVLTGFWAGLALDVAPPGSHFVGQNALVFCLIGYACGLLADDSSGDAAEQGHTALFEIVVTATGAVCGEVLAALLGVMLSDPRVTWPAIRNVLPAAVAYDVLLCPFVLYAVAAALRLAGARGEGRRAGWSANQVRAPVPGANQGAIRQLAGGDVLRLRLSDRDKGSGAVAGLRGPGAGRPPARREPRLKLGRAGPRSSTAAYRDGPGAGAARVRFGGRRREGVLGGSLLGSASPGGSALRGSGLGGSGSLGLGGSMFGSSSMGRSLLGGSVFSRSSSALGPSSALGHRFGRPAVFGRSAPLGRSSSLRHQGNPMRSAGGGRAGHAPRFSRGGSLTRLTGSLRGSTGPKSPGRGWLRGASSRGHSPGRNSLGGTSLSRRAFGRRRMGGDLRRLRVWAGPSTPRLKAARTGSVRLRMPRPKAKRRWRTGGYR
jgi:rod shape-determining protein MreD